MKYILLSFSLCLVFMLQAQSFTPISLSEYDGSNIGAKLEAADFDGDGLQEFVLINGGGLLIYELDTYDPLSWEPTVFGSGFGTVLDLQTDDLNGDSFADISFGNGDGIHLLLNNGIGSFTYQLIDVGISLFIIRDLGVGDVDGDGDMDITICLNEYVRWIENIDQWADNEVHIIADNGVGYRGSLALDFDSDGDIDIAAEHGAIGFPMVVYLQDGDDWTEQELIGMQGGTYSVDLADIDGDGYLTIGTGNNNNIDFYDLGTGEVQSIGYGNGLADGGSFVDLTGDGTLEWIQVGWAQGDVVYVDFDENGTASDVIETGLNLPSAHDLYMYDGDGNGIQDLFFATYGGTETIGVVPDFELPLSIDEEVDNRPTLVWDEAGITITDLDNQIDRIAVTSLSGKLVFSKVAPNGQRITTPDLGTGIYIVSIETQGSSYDFKVFRSGN